VGQLVASRKLVGPSGAQMLVSIGAPEQASVDDWTCRFSLGEQTHQAHGIDALQALIMAIEGLRTHLSRAQEPWTWAGGEPGDHGIPRHIPTAFGLQFADSVGKLLDEQIAQFAENAKRRPRSGGTDA
jgi:hypothetical protein